MLKLQIINKLKQLFFLVFYKIILVTVTITQRHLPAASALTLSNLLSPVWRLAHHTHYHVTKTKIKETRLTVGRVKA